MDTLTLLDADHSSIQKDIDNMNMKTPTSLRTTILKPLNSRRLRRGQPGSFLPIIHTKSCGISLQSLWPLSGPTMDIQASAIDPTVTRPLDFCFVNAGFLSISYSILPRSTSPFKVVSSRMASPSGPVISLPGLSLIYYLSYLGNVSMLNPLLKCKIECLGLAQQFEKVRPSSESRAFSAVDIWNYLAKSPVAPSNMGLELPDCCDCWSSIYQNIYSFGGAWEELLWCESWECCIMFNVYSRMLRG